MGSPNRWPIPSDIAEYRLLPAGMAWLRHKQRHESPRLRDQGLRDQGGLSLDHVMPGQG